MYELLRAAVTKQQLWRLYSNKKLFSHISGTRRINISSLGQNQGATRIRLSLEAVGGNLPASSLDAPSLHLLIPFPTRDLPPVLGLGPGSGSLQGLDTELHPQSFKFFILRRGLSELLRLVTNLR